MVWLRAARKTASMRPTNIVRASAEVSAAGFATGGVPANVAPGVPPRTGGIGFALGRIDVTRKASELRCRKLARGLGEIVPRFQPLNMARTEHSSFSQTIESPARYGNRRANHGNDIG